MRFEEVVDEFELHVYGYYYDDQNDEKRWFTRSDTFSTDTNIDRHTVESAIGLDYVVDGLVKIERCFVNIPDGDGHIRLDDAWDDVFNED